LLFRSSTVPPYCDAEVVAMGELRFCYLTPKTRRPGDGFMTR
jgi:hypothetical protein